MTCPPSGDIAAIHDRMGAIPEHRSLLDWLDGPEVVARGLVGALPDGSLHVEPADDVDWTGP